MVIDKMPFSFIANSFSIIFLPSNLKPSFSSLVFLMMLLSSATKAFSACFFGLGVCIYLKYNTTKKKKNRFHIVYYFKNRPLRGIVFVLLSVSRPSFLFAKLIFFSLKGGTKNPTVYWESTTRKPLLLLR
jgi:hypothetical protein